MNRQLTFNNLIIFNLMKQCIIKSIAFIALWLTGLLPLHADDSADDWIPNAWAVVTMTDGMDMPQMYWYYGMREKAPNGTEYRRIYSCKIYEPTPGSGYVKLPYGYRLADKQIYIYNFETGEEKLGFDFNLKAGERFTTYNGMEWVVENVCDTLVNISCPFTGVSYPFLGEGDWMSKRLLKVRSADGKLTDQWLEDFGSFSYRCMIYSMENLKLAQTLWMEYDYGVYLTREIRADPFFTHDTGWLDGKGWDDRDENDEKYSGCSYKDGAVTFENKEWYYAHRAYTCYYRKGDDIYRFHATDLDPQIEGGEKVLCKDVVTFEGLPEPASGRYVIHTDKGDYATGINRVSAPASAAPDALYDLQGRRLSKEPVKGLYIKNGTKKMAE